MIQVISRSAQIQRKLCSHFCRFQVKACYGTPLFSATHASKLGCHNISGCQKLKLEAPVGDMSMFLEYLRVEECDCIDDASPELLPKARSLTVQFCDNLTRLFIPTTTETLNISDWENLEKLLVACEGTHMTELYIRHCWKLKWLPEHMQKLLPSLNLLYMINCPEIDSFPQEGLRFILIRLWIRNCKKLVNGQTEWRL